MSELTPGTIEYWAKQLRGFRHRADRMDNEWVTQHERINNLEEEKDAWKLTEESLLSEIGRLEERMSEMESRLDKAAQLMKTLGVTST